MAFIAKLICDISLWLAPAGFVLSCFGDVTASLLPAGIIVLCAGASALLLKRAAWLRLLPLAGLFACIAFMRGVCDVLLYTPPCIYAVYLCATRRYSPKYGECEAYFRPAAVTLLTLYAFALFMCGSGKLETYCAPYVVAFLCAGVLMLRMLRQDEAVRREPMYAALNAVSIAFVCVLCVLVSSPQFMGGVGVVLRLVYDYVITPLMIGFAYVVAGVCWLIVSLVRRLESAEPESFQFELSLEPGGGYDAFPNGFADGERPELLILILTIVGIALAILFAVLLLRRLAGSKSGAKPEQNGNETRERILETSLEKGMERPKRFGTPTEAVRYYYRKYALLLQSMGVTIAECDTSESLCEKSRGRFDENDARDMRSIYILARYGGESTREDARRARELYKSMKRRAQTAERGR